jgi:integrase
VNTNTAYALAPASTQPHLHPGAVVPPSAMTLEAFLVDYIKNHINQLIVQREYRSMILKYFGPLLPYTLAEITPLMVESWFHDIGAHSYSQANKSLSMLRAMFGRAWDWRVFTGDNPAQRVRKYPKQARTRFVQPKEMPALMTALQREREAVQCFFLLCLLVGCRRTEGLTLKWADLDVAGGLWHKSRTKTSLAHTIPIPLSLLQRIDALPRLNEWVFATKQGHWCKTVASERWAVIRATAGLHDVTIHDLRRTCASWLACNGANLAIIGRGVLNHTSLAHTAIYARLNVSPVTQALEENSVRMLGSSPPARPVIPREPTTPPPSQAPAWSPSRGEERDEWPG